MKRKVECLNDREVDDEIYNMILTSVLSQIKSRIEIEVEKSGVLSGEIDAPQNCSVYSTNLKNLNDSIREELELIRNSKKETEIYYIDWYDGECTIGLQEIAVLKINKNIFGAEATVSLTSLGKKFCKDIQHLAKAEGIILKPIPKSFITYKSGCFGSRKIINHIPGFDIKTKLKGELRRKETLFRDGIDFLFELQ